MLLKKTAQAFYVYILTLYGSKNFMQRKKKQYGHYKQVSLG